MLPLYWHWHFGLLFTSDTFIMQWIFDHMAFFFFSLGCWFYLRELEPIRLLGLQFLGKLLIGLRSERKGAKFFSLAVGRTKSLADNQRKGIMMPQLIFSAISEKLFKFPLSDNLCATLFDVLLGGASPKQVRCCST